MNKTYRLLIIFIVISGIVHTLFAQPTLQHRILDDLVRDQKQIMNVHPFLKKLYPVAMADGKDFYIYDLDSTVLKYELVKRTSVPFEIPENFAASFPLAEYEARPSCILGSGILTQTDVCVTIFHEFMHCAQMEHGEQDIKAPLQIYIHALMRDNYMWEITHEFPYADSAFTSEYSYFLQALQEQNHDKILKARIKLRETLSRIDYEYMCWQEWKEGFARFIENRLRSALSFAANEAGKDRPYDRISFYYGGDHFIRFIEKRNPDLLFFPSELFTAIFNPAHP